MIHVLQTCQHLYYYESLNHKIEMVLILRKNLLHLIPIAICWKKAFLSIRLSRLLVDILDKLVFFEVLKCFKFQIFNLMQKSDIIWNYFLEKFISYLLLFGSDGVFGIEEFWNISLKSFTSLRHFSISIAFNASALNLEIKLIR